MKLIPKCVNCNKELQTEQYIDGKISTRLTTDYDEVVYDLNNGSKMRVAVCTKCKKAKVDDEVVLGKVKATWARELTRLSETGQKDIDIKYKDLKLVKPVVKPKPVQPIKKEQ